jgi:hypothetical protein
MYFPLVPYYLVPLSSSLNVSDIVSHPYKTTGKITLLYILKYTFLELLTNSALNLRHL